MNRSTSRGGVATVVWAIVFALGAIGLLLNAYLQPGFSARYVKDTTMSFVKIEVAPPIGAALDEKPTEAWVPADSPRLSELGVRRLDVPPITWIEAVPVPPVEAWKAADRDGLAADGSPVRMSWTDTIGVWIAAFLTLAILSFLWRDNPVYKLAESIVVGVSAAYWMVVGFWSTIVPNLFQPLLPGLVQAWALPGTKGEYVDGWWISLIPLLLGIMLLMRLAPKGGWISIWPLAFIFGTTAGLKLVAFTQTDFLAQLSNSIVPLYVLSPDAADPAQLRWDVAASVGNLVLITGILCTLAYFFFSIEHKGFVGKASRLGIWVLMITFGSAFAFTVMGRIALLSQRLEFLFNDWLWLIDPRGTHTRVVEAVATLVTLS
jgi:hypothetical protein